MNTPSQPPVIQPTDSTGSSQPRRAELAARLFQRLKEICFQRLKEIYFFGGIALVITGGVTASEADRYGSGSGMGFAGLGLCIAGGLCFVASAIIHSRDTAR